MMMANPRPLRNPALDFTKGALVLFMVLYHWLNYFISADGDFYRYIRFVTPSFIFITGFVMSNVYLAKYELSDSRLPKRLLQRGLKILAIFVVLNIVISLLLSRSHDGRTLFSLFSASNLFAIYVTGNTVIAGGGKLAAGVAVTASLVGVVSFINGRRHREIPANVAANAQRRAARVTANAAVIQRNRERLAQAHLIMAPAAGVGP